MTIRQGPLERYLAHVIGQRIKRGQRVVLTDALGHDSPTWVSKWRAGVLCASIDELVTICEVLGLDLPTLLATARTQRTKRTQKRAR